MIINNPLCLFIMPFRSEFTYFYLYLQKHLTEKFKMRVERGDHRTLTKPLIEKIKEQIREADVIIAEITDSNPNVLYEIGLAHAYGKPVIFLTQNDPEKSPVDLRQFEFITYDLNKHVDFLNTLDQAIQSLFAERYEGMYEAAQDMLIEFNKKMSVKYGATLKAEFLSRVTVGEKNEGIPNSDNEKDYMEFLLPKIANESTEIHFMKCVMEWISIKFPIEKNSNDTKN